MINKYDNDPDPLMSDCAQKDTNKAIYYLQKDSKKDCYGLGNIYNQESEVGSI
jgi:hypothetical protein